MNGAAVTALVFSAVALLLMYAVCWRPMRRGCCAPERGSRSQIASLREEVDRLTRLIDSDARG